MNNSPSHKKNQSGATNWIGFLVLGFGFICLLAVGLMIFSERFKGDLKGDGAAGVSASKTTSVAGQPSVGAQSGGRPSTSSVTSDTNELRQSLNQMRDTPKSQSGTKSSAKISESDVGGNWDVDFGNGQGVLQLSEGVYRLIVRESAGAQQRFYSNGHYKVEGDYYLSFTPDLTIMPPDDGEVYRSLVLNPVAMRVEMRGNYMIWTKPPIDAPVLSPVIHPILRYGADQLIVWQRF